MVMKNISHSTSQMYALIPFRSVETQDKAFAQGLSLFLFSLFALIPGPIYYGRVIDNACLIWNSSSGREGNCQLYDPGMLKSAIYSRLLLFNLLFFSYFQSNFDTYCTRILPSSFSWRHFLTFWFGISQEILNCMATQMRNQIKLKKEQMSQLKASHSRTAHLRAIQKK